MNDDDDVGVWFDVLLVLALIVTIVVLTGEILWL